MTKFKRKAQSVTEYAILLGVAIAVFAGMQLYVKRGLNARIKQATTAATMGGGGASQNIMQTGGDIFDSTDLSGITRQGGGAVTAANFGMALGNQEQYEPYYTESQSKTYQESVEREQLKDGKISKEIVSEISGSAAGSYRAEKTYQDADETKWED